MNQSLRYLGKKIGLPFNLQFHCSRHTYGSTLLLNKGVDLNVFSHLMGHSSTGVTQKVWRINKKTHPR
ncbi:MAG: tyrosine-type recombinase/integrase [Muribaculaceae bacterium]|nr:tyrosine-type recombinase/integrase [Muribaculaceae bacterium]